MKDEPRYLKILDYLPGHSRSVLDFCTASCMLAGLGLGGADLETNGSGAVVGFILHPLKLLVAATMSSAYTRSKTRTFSLSWKPEIPSPPRIFLKSLIANSQS